MQIINGSILDASEQYIVHQCNCVSTNALGLAKDIFEEFPYANCYKNRINKNIPGTIQICGNGQEQRYVVNLFGQYYPGKANSSNDTINDRLNWFRDGMKSLIITKNCKSIAIPYNIGCGLAKGNWLFYYSFLVCLSEQYKNSINIVIYRI